MIKWLFCCSVFFIYLNMKKVSVIGCGRIAWQLEKDSYRYHPCTHIGAIIKSKMELEIVSVCDLSEKLANEVADFIATERKDWQRPLVETDFRKVLQNKPNVVVIASSTFSHYPILKETIEAGVENIVIEKPIVANRKDLAELKSLLNKFPQYKSKIWVNYERRYHKKYIDLKKKLQKQAWGKSLFYRGWLASPSSSFFPDRHGEGILLHDTTHLLDLVVFLFGDARAKKETKKRNFAFFQSQSAGVKTHLLELFHRDLGIEGSLLSSRFSPFFHFELEIICERARIKVGNGFFSVEKTAKSRLYRNFVSLESPLLESDKKVTLSSNPFLQLYKEVALESHDTKEVEKKLEQAIHNIELLN